MNEPAPRVTIRGCRAAPDGRLPPCLYRACSAVCASASIAAFARQRSAGQLRVATHLEARRAAQVVARRLANRTRLSACGTQTWRSASRSAAPRRQIRTVWKSVAHAHAHQPDVLLCWQMPTIVAVASAPIVCHEQANSASAAHATYVTATHPSPMILSTSSASHGAQCTNGAPIVNAGALCKRRACGEHAALNAARPDTE